jgi:8-oxo-dGTP pyrophosphatase MutT (NUDIX family)
MPLSRAEARQRAGGVKKPQTGAGHPACIAQNPEQTMKQARPTDFADPANSAHPAALCWRMAGAGVEVLLITARRSGRWIVPKGHPIRGLPVHEAAAREAWEEAGVQGRVDPAPLGRYRPGSFDVQVHPLHVALMLDDYPEAGQRLRLWLAPEKAAQRVADPGLAALIAGFCPS